MSSKKKSKSKIAKERLPLPQSYLSPKDSCILKVKNDVGPSCCDPIHSVKQDGDGKIFVTQAVNRHPESRKRNASKGEELVKHMSNLPSYLQQTDSGENIQDKTLNVGVLDWSRLEKWKHKQNNFPEFGSKFASFNSSESSKTFTKSLSSGSTSKKLDDQQGFLPSSVNSSYKVGLPKGGKPSFHSAKRFQDSAEHRSSGKGKTRSDIPLEEEKRKGFKKMTSQVGNFASSLTYHGVLRFPNENTNGGVSESPEKSWEGSLELDLRKKDRKLNSISDMSVSKNKGASFGSKKKLNFSSNEAKKKEEQLQEPAIESDHKESHNKLKNIVLLRPRETPRSSSPEITELSKSRVLIDENLATPSQSSLSKFSSPQGVISEDLFYEYPHSHVLHPRMAEPAATLDTGQCSIDTGRGVDHSSVVSRTPTCSNKMYSLQKGTCTEMDALDSKLANHYVFSNLKESLDQETAELTARRGGNSSFSRRFSFNLSWIGRSLSFREGSTLQQLSSRSLGAKSGPVTSESSACLNNSSKEKSIGHNRSRSSSFRRFLDPILRNKGCDVHHSTEHSQSPKGSLGSISFRSMSVNESLNVEKSERTKSSPLTSESSACLNNSSKEISIEHNRSRSSSFRRFLDPILRNKAPDVHQSAESSQSPKGSLGSISFRSMSVNELHDVEKSERTTIKALLKLIIKDGLPLFQFVLNNEINILAAATKNLASPGKDDSGCNFLFYLVNEIKKKSGSLISQRSKEKHCRYAYNVVGQMKVSSNKTTEPVQNSNKRVVKEHVLSGVEIGQTDEGAPKLIHNQELAAAIVEIPCENLSHRGMLCNKSLLKKDGCSCDSGEVELPISTTVILPGGIHGLADKGEPSPLIYRWKSGGLCDCGGWDIGCKLIVLSNDKQSSESYNDNFHLFVQEGAEQDNKSLFSLVPLNDGLYSVEFDSSITHLQAFFISVVVLSCQKLPNFLGMSDLHEEIVKELSLKTDHACQGKEPVYYTSIPPLSPVGRF